MSSKQSAKRTEEKKKSKDAKKDSKKISSTKTRCSAPIATGAAMTQRVLTPTVCCPPQGNQTKYLYGPGCRNC